MPQGNYAAAWVEDTFSKKCLKRVLLAKSASNEYLGIRYVYAAYKILYVSFFFNVVGFWFPLWISLTNTSLLNCRVIFVRDGGDMWRSFVVDVVALH